MGTAQVALLAVLTVSGLASVVSAQGLPEWTTRIRQDHPRLFFNSDTWPAVCARAIGPERAWHDEVREDVDKVMAEMDGDPKPEPEDLGPEAAEAAFVYLVTGEQQYLDLAKKVLDTSLRFYEKRYAERKSVAWRSNTRVNAVMALDWMYNDLEEDERREYMQRFVRVTHAFCTADPPIPGESARGYTWILGNYSAESIKWYLGCAAFGTGVEEELVSKWLVSGYDLNMKMLNRRRATCGNDGGSAAPTVAYAFLFYPWAEQNFLYTWRSATGEDIGADWSHSAWFANYVMWNWIETNDAPMEFGYGDTYHQKNLLPLRQMYTNLSNDRHLFARSEPEAAGLARYMQQRLKDKRYGWEYFIYPFLWTNLDESPPAYTPKRLPHARHFEGMGQTFMRSGDGPDDTYALFVCGGIIGRDHHRHQDSLSFIIYHKGHLAMDSGTRIEEDDPMNELHLANYYGQSVAHNCVLVHKPGEPPAYYWGGPLESNCGGQRTQPGSVVKAFETNDRYVYVAGDATACYLYDPDEGLLQEEQEAIAKMDCFDLSDKVSLVTRQFVFLVPNHFVIFDRVVSTDPSYRKDWLLHTAHEPSIEGRTFRADRGEGRLFCRTLLPEDAKLTTVGGPGKEFWSSGKNWDITRDVLKPGELEMMGQWRVEVTPGAQRAEDFFLHVIQVGDQSLASMEHTALIRRDASVGVRLAAGDRTWEVTFDTAGDLGGHIRLKGPREDLDRDLTTEVMPQAGIAETTG